MPAFSDENTSQPKTFCQSLANRSLARKSGVSFSPTSSFSPDSRILSLDDLMGLGPENLGLWARVLLLHHPFHYRANLGGGYEFTASIWSRFGLRLGSYLDTDSLRPR